MYNVDEEKRSVLMDEYKYVIQRLEDLEQSGEINELEKQCIITSMREVLRLIAEKYKKVVAEGEKVMGGELLEYPAKTSYREGRAEGLREGRADGLREGINNILSDLIQSGIITEEEAAIRAKKASEAMCEKS